MPVENVEQNRKDMPKKKLQIATAEAEINESKKLSKFSFLNHIGS
jgi:hypothetical protein